MVSGSWSRIHPKFGSGLLRPSVPGSRKSEVLLQGLKSVVRIYSQRGFKVTHALMDNEFELLRGDPVKERMRTVVTSLPFERLPPRLIVECAKSFVFW
jgi:hypothetical protein